MINLPDDDQNRFFFEGFESGFAEFVHVNGKQVGVFFERIRRVGIDQTDAILNLFSESRKIASVESANDRAAAESVREFSIESRQQILVGSFG